MNVDTKIRPRAQYGNDSASVDTKNEPRVVFDNDSSVGFVRVRRRKLKGGNGSWSRVRAPKASASYDIVKAERVNGKPRHRFVLGLGSLKDKPHNNDLEWFWIWAFQKMSRYGLTKEQSHRIAIKIANKGASLPRLTYLKSIHDGDWLFVRTHAAAVLHWLAEMEAAA